MSFGQIFGFVRLDNPRIGFNLVSPASDAEGGCGSREETMMSDTVG